MIRCWKEPINPSSYRVLYLSLESPDDHSRGIFHSLWVNPHSPQLPQKSIAPHWPKPECKLPHCTSDSIKHICLNTLFFSLPLSDLILFNFFCLALVQFLEWFPTINPRYICAVTMHWQSLSFCGCRAASFHGAHLWHLGDVDNSWSFTCVPYGLSFKGGQAVWQDDGGVCLREPPCVCPPSLIGIAI